MKTHITLERGILFFEDGTEVSNVSVEMIKALPELLKAAKAAVIALDMDDKFGDDIDARHTAEQDAFHLLHSAIAKSASA